MISKNHATTKAEASLVESNNPLTRHYLVRFNRRTKRFTKAFDMIGHSLLLIFNKTFNTNCCLAMPMFMQNLNFLSFFIIKLLSFLY